MLSHKARGSSISCSPGRAIGVPVRCENCNFFFIAVMMSFLSLSSWETLDFVIFFSLKVWSRCFLLGACTLGVFSITDDTLCKNYC